MDIVISLPMLFGYIGLYVFDVSCRTHIHSIIVLLSGPLGGSPEFISSGVPTDSRLDGGATPEPGNGG